MWLSSFVVQTKLVINHQNREFEFMRKTLFIRHSCRRRFVLQCETPMSLVTLSVAFVDETAQCSTVLFYVRRAVVTASGQ